MALLIQSLGCPNCGAPYEEKTRNCGFCGSVLIVTSLNNKFGGRSLDAHQISESLAKWRQRIKDEPDNIEAHYALGLGYLNAKLRDQAIVHIRKAIALAPEMADLHYTLAIALFNDGVYSTSEYEEIEKEIKFSIQLTSELPEARAFQHYFMGIKLSNIDNMQALAEYKRAIEFCADIPVMHNNLGACFEEAKKFSEAEACYQRAIDLDPTDPYFHNMMCQLMYQIKKYSEGAEAGFKSISFSNDHADYYNNLARCLWALNRIPEALEYSYKAIAIEPDNKVYNENVLTYRNDLLSRLWKPDKTPEPIENTAKVLEYINMLPKDNTLNEHLCRYYNALSLSLWKSKWMPRAIEYISKAVAISQNNDLYKDNLATYYNDFSVDLWKSNNTPEAIDYINKAIAIYPDNVLYKNNLNTYKSNIWMQNLKIKRAYAFNDNPEYDSVKLINKASNKKYFVFLIILMLILAIFLANDESNDQNKNKVSFSNGVSQPQSSTNVATPPNTETPKKAEQKVASIVTHPDIKVGDVFVIESINQSHPENNYKTERTVVSTDGNSFELSVINLNSKAGKKRLLKFNNEWNLISTRNADNTGLDYSPPLKYFEFPLSPGKTWRQASTETNIKTGAIRKHNISAVVGDWEDITVPAGTFHAIKLSLNTEVVNPVTGEKSTGTDTSWYAPDVKRTIKSDVTSRNEADNTEQQSVAQLISFKGGR